MSNTTSPAQQSRLVCATRAIKNASIINEHAAAIVPVGTAIPDVCASLPLPVLASLHQAANPAGLVADQHLKEILSGITFPIIEDKVTGPLFSGLLHFVQIKFKVANQGNTTISVSDPDMATIVTYAGAVSSMISAYANQYGAASLAVSPAVIPLTVQLATNQYNDAQLQQLVNQISAALPANSALAIPNPLGIVNTNGTLANGTFGYHGIANVPYLIVNLRGTGLSVDDKAQFFATNLSHEIAEMTVDPRADSSNPEVCDPCGPNCQSTVVDFFRIDGSYLGSQQWPSQPAYSFDLQINAIVMPRSSRSCPAPLSDCAYGLFGWVDNDLTQWTHGAPAAPGSGLDGYWGSDNSQHVNYLDAAGHVHELYIHPGAAGWVDNDLTQWTHGAPAAPGSGLDGYWGSDNSQHVNYLDAAGHVHELYIHPGAAGWVDNDLTQWTHGAPAAPGSGLDGYWGSDDSQHVNYLDAAGHVHELYIHPGAAGWVDNDLTQWTHGAPAAPGSGLDGYWGSDDSQHVNYLDAAGHVHELYIHPGAAGWVDNDLTQWTHGAPAAPGSGLDGYWGSDNSQHVNYLDAAGHVHELYIHPGAAGWVDNDLTQWTHGAPAAPGSGLDGYWGSDDSQHVNYLDAAGHVHELYIHPGAAAWVDNDLTRFAAGPAATGRALDGYWGKDDSQHVNYLDKAGHVHELYIHP